MTRYEIGFINKCAEYNIDAEKATILLKNSTLQKQAVGPAQETTKGHRDSHNRANFGRALSYVISPLKAGLAHLTYGIGYGTAKAVPKIDKKYNKLKVRVADLASKWKDGLIDHLFNPENQGLNIRKTSGKVIDAIADTVEKGVVATGEYLGKKVPADYKAKTGTGKAVEAIDRLKINPEFETRLKQNLEAYKLPNFNYSPWLSLPPYGTDSIGNPNSQKSPTDFLKLLETKKTKKN